MFVVRYRTLGPWQSERVDKWEEADHMAAELAKTYGEVVVDFHFEAVRYSKGKLLKVQDKLPWKVLTNASEE
jgi:hypothetical protein